ncbi:unnamed protein product [Plutella xylostella]|uniref:(diamondback moth) hypothetical protein n=1 Tax=Plutella xylostella TaxID=51655 RepID=A0A8S4D9A5_PLUXY|nr:unnamed protein product [Plutella xylostella]
MYAEIIQRISMTLLLLVVTSSPSATLNTIMAGCEGRCQWTRHYPSN